MKYTVRAFLLRAGGKITRDLGKIYIEVRGPLKRDAVTKFQYLGKTEVGTIDHVERYSKPGKMPTVHIVQSLGE
jgi:hypothetical protein